MAERKIDPIVAALVEDRNSRGIKQRAMADHLGITSGRLSSYESGGVSPQLDFLRRWSEWFGYRMILESDGMDSVSEAEPDGVYVELSRYQIALAMGMLIAAGRDENISAQMGADLREITDALARAL